ncbi:hypothetical protein [Nocardia sp. NPDC006630]|uniref:hypothetical protein n=1 Tax=Nocardia sp. NPDC006630 TaxID=3157181 RepID=UPI0033AFF990
MTQVSAPIETTLSERSFLTATLQSVQRCPARPDYLELRFATVIGFWQWCFPEPPQRPGTGRRAATTPVALVFGRYGAQAHRIRNGTLGAALQSSAALPMILSGAGVLVERRLIAADPTAWVSTPS